MVHFITKLAKIAPINGCKMNQVIKACVVSSNFAYLRKQMRKNGIFAIFDQKLRQNVQFWDKKSKIFKIPA